MSAMGTVARRNLRAHKVRLALTLISVLLGTAFVAGSFIFTDTLKSSFDKIFATGDAGIDSRVQPRNDFDPGVPMSLVPRIQAVPGARTVAPQVSGPIVLVKSDGTKIQSNGAPSMGGNWSRVSVNPIPTFVSGHAPTNARQVVINNGAATQHDLQTGDHVKVVVQNARVVNATISGVYQTTTDTGGYIGALFDNSEALKLFTDGKHYSYVDIAAAPGVSEQTLTHRIDKVVPSYLEVKTGTQVRDDETKDIASALSFINYVLLGFGIVALLVGTFIIYNTFTMIVAQRQRELALLRAIGADRKQIRRSVVFEATVIGVLGSALGLAGGIGLAQGLHALLNSFNLGLPSGGLVLSARAVIITLVLGTIVTVLAAFTPARRAAKIPPVAAMREEFAPPSAAGLRRRNLIGIVFGAVGIVATVGAATVSSAGSSALLAGAALVAMCTAAMLLAPVLSRWIVVPLGRVVGAPFGTVGELARTNAVRNPRRTAATAFALTLGLVLVAGIAVIGSSVKASLAKIVDNTVTADYIVTTQGQLPVPEPAAQAAADVPGAATATVLHPLGVLIDGKREYGTGVDGRLTSVTDVPIVAGSAKITGNDLLVSQKKADNRGWHLGETVTFTAPDAPAIQERITGIYSQNNLLGPFLASGSVYRQVTPSNEQAAYAVLVNAAPGTSLDELRTQLERATDKYYVVTVEDKDGFKGTIANQVNGLIGLLYGLLGLAIVIAILGIINTLALSVVERRREIGMLRAIGMQRAQVRRTVYLESLLIAVFGAVLGLVLGLSYGSLFTRGLRSAGLDKLSVPIQQSILFLVLAAVVGVLAALWPGIRAARTRPLAAIAEE
jgi:putative ABC transport system permease protein